MSPVAVRTPTTRSPSRDQTGDRCVLQHVHASLHRALGIGPHHPVVAGRRCGDVVARTEHRVATAAGEVELRTQLLDLGGCDEHRLGTACSVEHRPRPFVAHRRLGVRQPEQALGGVHDPAACLVLELGVQIEAVLVEPDRLGDAVVGADDRGVATRVARSDVVGLEHGNVGDAVPGGQVVRGGEAVATTTDDHDVVARLGLVPGELQQRLDELVHARTPDSWKPGRWNRSTTSWAKPLDTISRTRS